ncbi:alpha/beta hydrolase [Luteolibacter arcticus]|uniref:Alpha/beta hydrolase n=1 Tax=Luteolibacter arcticus TaxID=1581411 RepID=A0ABT3GF43_9BACT|nr:alpha/beta hydrolase [Luteolibacter arcticus]MCW1922238.1 alpha/beta hydrolase [Luteolibacter arcticus]
MKEDEQMRLPDGRALGYADYGDPAGEPVFFFHGWPSSRYQGKLLHELAAERGLRLIAPDRPGVGLSDPLPGRGFASWPGDVAGLADALGIGRFKLYGISGGGPYTLATAAALPDRVIAAAVLCGAPPFGGAEDRAGMHWAYRGMARLRKLRNVAMPVVVSTSRWMIARGAERAPMTWMLRSIPPSDREAILDAGCWESVTRSYLEGVRKGPAHTLADGELYLEPWDFSPEDIRVPVAFWHGLADKNLPCEVAKRLAARVPGAEGHWEEGEGHYSLPLRYRAQVLDWLRDQA